MPHLRFNITRELDKTEKADFAEWVIEQYAEIMQTPNDHIGIIMQNCELGDLHIGIGRITEPDKGVLFLNMDIRKGRTQDTKRKLIIAIMEEAERRWGIPVHNMHAAVTEHSGDDFNFHEGSMQNWSN